MFQTLRKEGSVGVWAPELAKLQFQGTVFQTALTSNSNFWQQVWEIPQTTVGLIIH